MTDRFDDEEDEEILNGAFVSVKECIESIRHRYGMSDKYLSQAVVAGLVNVINLGADKEQADGFILDVRTAML